MKGRVLIIAASDSGGGAGIQADIKTVTALGGYAMTALTALTAQNTKTVSAIYDIPVDFILQQIRVVSDDIGVDAIKIGMLHSSEVIEAVASSLKEIGDHIPVVVDPVMYAKSGDSLLKESAVCTLKEKLLPLASIITPNIPEARLLAGVDYSKAEDFEGIVSSWGNASVLVKGGHASGKSVCDMLYEKDGRVSCFRGKRLETRHTHGTGCTLSSAIAIGLAQGYDVYRAVKRAHQWVAMAIEHAPGYGEGAGPLNHGHSIANFVDYD